MAKDLLVGVLKIEREALFPDRFGARILRGAQSSASVSGNDEDRIYKAED